jgi:hypothetical protein
MYSKLMLEQLGIPYTASDRDEHLHASMSFVEYPTEKLRPFAQYDWRSLHLPSAYLPWSELMYEQRPTNYDVQDENTLRKWSQ